MEKLGLDLDDGSSPGDQRQANPQVTIIKIHLHESMCLKQIITFAGGEEIIHSKMHPVIGACLPVQRRKLQAPELPKDEAGCAAHENVQEKDQRRLSYMQAIDRSVLLPRKALPGEHLK